jgi:hypothetical protein
MYMFLSFTCSESFCEEKIRVYVISLAESYIVNSHCVAPKIVLFT